KPPPRLVPVPPALPRVPRQLDEPPTARVDPAPVRRAAGCVERARTTQERGELRLATAQRGGDNAPPALDGGALRQALGEVVAQHRVRADLKEHRVTVHGELLGGGGERHRTAYVVPPVAGVKLRPRGHPAGHAGVERDLPGSRLQAREAAQELVT